MGRTFKAGTRTHIACYSCLYSTVLKNEKGEKIVRCGLNGRTTRITAGVSFPDWCELYGFNHKRKEQENEIR